MLSIVPTVELARSDIRFSEYFEKWEITKWYLEDYPLSLLNFRLKFDSAKVVSKPEPEPEPAPEPAPEPVTKKAKSVGNDGNEDTLMCSICNSKKIDCCFNCGHCACSFCAANLKNCHLCRAEISAKIKMFL